MTLEPRAAVVTYRIAFGPRAGHEVPRLTGAMRRNAASRQLLYAEPDGSRLQAAQRCELRDRNRPAADPAAEDALLEGGFKALHLAVRVPGLGRHLTDPFPSSSPQSSR